MNTLFTRTIEKLEFSFDVLSSQVAPPELKQFLGGYVYRFKEQGIPQAIIQKLSRLVSGLRTIALLHEEGLLQEQAVVQRTIDEVEQDTVFLSRAIIDNNLTELHERYLEAFYEEEFDCESAIESSQKRPMIPRKKIIAYLARGYGRSPDPSTSRDAVTTVVKLYSGYVHGASPHIMEMYYGNPPRFHISGCKDSPLYQDHSEDLLNYLYRGICAFSISAKALGDGELCRDLHSYSIQFAESTGSRDQFVKPNDG